MRSSITLLEGQKNFDRSFRGDTLHPSTMELMDELGLADRLLSMPHAKLRQGIFEFAENAVTLADLSSLKIKYPYVTLLPQVHFLETIVEAAKRYPNFKLIMGAFARELISENGEIKGVSYKQNGKLQEIRATLTVGANGRYSHLRKQVGLESVSTSPPMDVLWFSLSRKPNDVSWLEGGLKARIKNGHMAVIFDRLESLQIAYPHTLQLVACCYIPVSKIEKIERKNSF